MIRKYAYAIIDPETRCEYIRWLAGDRAAAIAAGDWAWYAVGWPPKWEVA
jgi:hypothetical protein